MSVGRIAASALLVVAIGGCAALPPAGGTGSVHVRLMEHERALPGAVATAVRNPGVALLEERVAATSAADGRAELVLPPGSWYLSAHAASPPAFGWYGSNPLQVRSGERIDVAIPALPPVPPVAATPVPAGEESVGGEVLGSDGPVAGATVTFYLDATTQFRGPGYLEAQTDGQGTFEVRVSPGSYWLVARRRTGQHPYGPLEVGDDFGFAPANPVTVRAGERLRVGVPSVRVLRKSGWSVASSLRIRVRGTVRDAAGRPLSGFRAFLHAKATMLGKPEFVSEPSGPDGTYLIWVDRDGRYFLGARAEIGRARDEREAIGVFDGSPDHAIDVRLAAGDLEDRDITVEGGGVP